MAPLMKKGVDVEEKLSSSVIVPVFVDFGDLMYVPLGFYTRLQTTMIDSCRKVLENKRPKLFCNYTNLNFTWGEFNFDVYLIKIPAKIKVGVLPLDSSNDRDNSKFVSYLKQVLNDCMQKVKNDEPLIYHNVNPSLLVKCCRKKDVCCPQHGDGCDRDECANFWSLEELQDLTKDPFCTHDSVNSERFALNSVRHWLYADTGTVVVFSLSFCRKNSFRMFLMKEYKTFEDNFRTDELNNGLKFLCILGLELKLFWNPQIVDVTQGKAEENIVGRGITKH